MAAMKIIYGNVDGGGRKAIQWRNGENVGGVKMAACHDDVTEGGAISRNRQ